MSKYGKLCLAALTALVLASSVFQARAAEPEVGSEPPSAYAAEPNSAAASSELRSVNVARDVAGGPVVTLQGSGPMAYTTLDLENPHRLVIDLKGTVSRLDRNQVPVAQGGVLRVRAGQFRRSPEPVCRVVVDLDGPVPYKIETSGDGLKIAFGAGSGPLPVAGTKVAETNVAETKIAEAKPLDAPTPRAVSPETVEKLLRAPAFGAEEQPASLSAAPTGRSKSVV